MATGLLVRPGGLRCPLGGGPVGAEGDRWREGIAAVAGSDLTAHFWASPGSDRLSVEGDGSGSDSGSTGGQQAERSAG